jgi:predicted RNA-binding Zn-ribbon protein involved in translation (DUF1610 family)
MRDLLNVQAECASKQCDWKGKARLAKKFRPGRHPAITGVPCPKCSEHLLNRAESSRKLELRKEPA